MTTNPDYKDVHGDDPGVTPQQVGRVEIVMPPDSTLPPLVGGLESYTVKQPAPQAIPLNPQQTVVISGTTPDWTAQVASAEGVVSIKASELEHVKRRVALATQALRNGDTEFVSNELLDFRDWINDWLRAP